MIQKHRDLTKYIGQGVVYVDDKGQWRKMTIVKVFETADVDGKHLEFNLVERMKGKKKEHLYNWYRAELKGVDESSLYPNLTTYFSKLKKKLENQIDGNKFQMNGLTKRMEIIIRHIQDVTKRMYDDFLSKYRDKPYSLSGFKDFLNETTGIHDRFTKEYKEYDEAKKEYERRKAELAQLRKTLQRITRKERSKKIQMEWTLQNRTVIVNA